MRADKYDELFDGQKVIRLYNENMSIKEISEIVNIPFEPLRKRMHKIGIEIRKLKYEPCPICKNKIVVARYQKHMRSHWWAIKNNIYCSHCNSQHVVKDGFIRGEQRILCRGCNRHTTLNVSYSRKPKRTEGLSNIARVLRRTGHTYRSIRDFIKRNYRVSVDIKTVWNWINVKNQ